MIHTTETFVSKISKILGSEYDYSRVVWAGWNTSVSIVCPDHGVFVMYPGEISNPSSRRSKKCPTCAKEDRAVLIGNSIIDRFQQLHSERYDYSKIEYRSMREKIIVGCQRHGAFLVSPGNHLAGHGCPGCFSSGPSSQETKWMDGIEKLIGTPIARSVQVAGYRVVSDGVLGDVAIEFDGSYWHGREGCLLRDTNKTSALREAGYTVVRLRGSQARGYQLTDVPGAINIQVPDSPTAASVGRVAEIVKVLTKSTK